MRIHAARILRFEEQQCHSSDRQRGAATIDKCLERYFLFELLNSSAYEMGGPTGIKLDASRGAAIDLFSGSCARFDRNGRWFFRDDCQFALERPGFVVDAQTTPRFWNGLHEAQLQSLRAWRGTKTLLRRNETTRARVGKNISKTFSGIALAMLDQELPVATKRVRRTGRTYRRSPFTVHRSPFTVRRSALGVGRSALAFGVHRSALALPILAHQDM